AVDGQQGADRVAKADPRPPPHGGPDIAGLWGGDRVPDDRTMADPDGRRGGLSGLDPADHPLLLPPETRSRGAPGGGAREIPRHPAAGSGGIASGRSKRPLNRMAALSIINAETADHEAS